MLEAQLGNHTGAACFLVLRAALCNVAVVAPDRVAAQLNLVQVGRVFRFKICDSSVEFDRVKRDEVFKVATRLNEMFADLVHFRVPKHLRG